MRTFLDTNPDLYQLSVNEVLATLKDARVPAGRPTVAEVLQERKQTK
jgi:hypothetical protein